MVGMPLGWSKQAVVISRRKTHPKALFTLIFGGLWEKFCFFGMLAGHLSGFQHAPRLSS